MAGSESWGLVGGRSFDFFFSLVVFSVLVGGRGCTGYLCREQQEVRERERERERKRERLLMSHKHVGGEMKIYSC